MRGARRTSLLAGALLLPAALHLGLLSWSVRREGFLHFGRLDQILLLTVCVYIGAAWPLSQRPLAAKRFALVVYALLLPLGAFELGLGLLGGQSPDGLPWRPLRRIATAAETMPGVTGEIVFTVNRHGVRGPEIWPEARADRILCVGGSTTECLYVTDRESWPWRLGTRLSRRLGRPVLVGNAGRSGNRVDHHLYQLRNYRYADRYGLVVILCGINDAGTLLRGRRTRRPERLAEEALHRPPTQNAAYYRHTFLYQSLRGFWRLVRATPEEVVQDPAGEWYREVRRQRLEALRKQTFRTLPDDLDEALQRYAETIREIIRLCRERDQAVVFLTQPTLYKEEMDARHAALLWQHTTRGAHTPAVLAQANAAFNEALLTVCDAEGVPCLDLASRLPRDTSVFYDDCHFNSGGCRLVAEEVEAFLLATGSVRPAAGAAGR
jgi:lysophospholipase L1-like esterase